MLHERTQLFFARGGDPHTLHCGSMMHPCHCTRGIVGEVVFELLDGSAQLELVGLVFWAVALQTHISRFARAALDDAFDGGGGGGGGMEKEPPHCACCNACTSWPSQSSDARLWSLSTPFLSA